MKNQLNYFESNSGLGHGELSFFLQIDENRFICVGYRLYENDESYALGEIVSTVSHWEDLDQPDVMMDTNMKPCENPTVLIKTTVLNLIIEQMVKIKELEETNKKQESNLKHLKHQLEKYDNNIQLPY